MRTGMFARRAASMPALLALTAGDAAESTAAAKARIRKARFRLVMESSVGQVPDLPFYRRQVGDLPNLVHTTCCLANLQTALARRQYLAGIQAVVRIEQ